MTEKRFTPYKNNDRIVGFKDNITGKHHCSIIEAIWLLNHFWEKTQRLTEENIRYEEHIEDLTQENKELKEKIEKLQRFGHTGEHIRLSINIETGKLQRHIYTTGQWFGDFDRVLCTNWISEKEYQRFIDRVIEVYNTEFKKELKSE